MLTLAGALWINLFNFMDGIDGLAATEAIFILCAAVLLSIPGFLQLQGDYLALPLRLWMLGLAAAASVSCCSTGRPRSSSWAIPAAPTWAC